MLLLLLLMFVINSCVITSKSCGQENVFGAKGGEVVLQVHHTGIQKINWVLLPEGNNIATTKPGGSIKDDGVRKPYKGKVSGDADGFLHIYHLSWQDQRIYNADVEGTEEDICVHFNITVYERLSDGDIKINHSFTRNDSCSLSLLCTVDKRNVTITWSHSHGGHINVSKGVLYVPPSDVNFTYTCTARNPVSNASKTVIPGSFCNTETSNLTRKSDLPWILGIVFTACVIIILFVIYKIMGKGRSNNNDISTTYAQVEASPIQQQNLYHERQKEQSLTVYSEVQHAKKTNSQKKKTVKDKPSPIETVYSTVQLSKEDQQNGTDALSAGPSSHRNITNKA